MIVLTHGVYLDFSIVEYTRVMHVDDKKMVKCSKLRISTCYKHGLCCLPFFLSENVSVCMACCKGKESNTGSFCLGTFHLTAAVHHQSSVLIVFMT